MDTVVSNGSSTFTSALTYIGCQLAIFLIGYLYGAFRPPPHTFSRNESCGYSCARYAFHKAQWAMDPPEALSRGLSGILTFQSRRIRFTVMEALGHGCKCVLPQEDGLYFTAVAAGPSAPTGYATIFWNGEQFMVEFIDECTPHAYRTRVPFGLSGRRIFSEPHAVGKAQSISLPATPHSVAPTLVNSGLLSPINGNFLMPPAKRNTTAISALSKLEELEEFRSRVSYFGKQRDFSPSPANRAKLSPVSTQSNYSEESYPDRHSDDEFDCAFTSVLQEPTTDSETGLSAVFLSDISSTQYSPCATLADLFETDIINLPDEAEAPQHRNTAESTASSFSTPEITTELVVSADEGADDDLLEPTARATQSPQDAEAVTTVTTEELSLHESLTSAGKHDVSRGMAYTPPPVPRLWKIRNNQESLSKYVGDPVPKSISGSVDAASANVTLSVSDSSSQYGNKCESINLGSWKDLEAADGRELLPWNVALFPSHPVGENSREQPFKAHQHIYPVVSLFKSAPNNCLPDDHGPRGHKPLQPDKALCDKAADVTMEISQEDGRTRKQSSALTLPSQPIHLAELSPDLWKLLEEIDNEVDVDPVTDPSRGEEPAPALSLKAITWDRYKMEMHNQIDRLLMKSVSHDYANPAQYHPTWRNEDIACLLQEPGRAQSVLNQDKRPRDFAKDWPSPPPSVKRYERDLRALASSTRTKDDGPAITLRPDSLDAQHQSLPSRHTEPNPFDRLDLFHKNRRSPLPAKFSELEWHEPLPIRKHDFSTFLRNFSNN